MSDYLRDPSPRTNILSYTNTELGVLYGLVGLGVAVMQKNQARALEFTRLLDDREYEKIAAGVVAGLQMAVDRASDD